MILHVTCYMCDDYLYWDFDRWLCPNCDRDTIQRLKCIREIQELTQKLKRRKQP